MVGFVQIFHNIPQDMGHVSKISQLTKVNFSLPETNIAPKHGWLEYYFPIGEAYFQWLC